MMLYTMEVVSYTNIICMILVYDTPHYKAGHSGGILAGIIHSEIASMLMWQRIKEERGVRVTSVHACIGKHIFL